MKDSLIYVAGQRTFEELKGTLAGGTVTLPTRLKKWRVWSITQVEAVGVAEGLSITNTPDAEGWYHGSVVVDSSGAGSTSKVLVVLSGY